MYFLKIKNLEHVPTGHAHEVFCHWSVSVKQVCFVVVLVSVQVDNNLTTV